MEPDNNRYFQVLNYATGRYVKYDRELGRVTEAKKTKGKFRGIPVYKGKVVGGKQ